MQWFDPLNPSDSFILLKQFKSKFPSKYVPWTRKYCPRKTMKVLERTDFCPCASYGSIESIQICSSSIRLIVVNRKFTHILNNHSTLIIPGTNDVIITSRAIFFVSIIVFCEIRQNSINTVFCWIN